jgi:hypothetical protein
LSAVSALHFMRGIRKSNAPSTLFIKMRYDLPNFPPHYLLLHNLQALNFVHAASISQRHPAALAASIRPPSGMSSALIFILFPLV